MQAVATYNVWFGTDGRGSPFADERMDALARVLLENSSEECPLLFVGFQEVVPELSRTLRPAFQAAGYKWLEQPDNCYGCALAARHGQLQPETNNQQEAGLTATILEHGWQPYHKTDMKRGFLWVRARLKDHREILFSTTHLESPIDAEGQTNGPKRVGQIRQLEAFCEEKLKIHEHLSMAIISGDLNWDESVRDIDLLSSALQTNFWRDAWLESISSSASGKDSTKNEEGYTFDSQRNPFIHGFRRRRLDRVLIRDKTEPGPGFRPSAITDAKLVGTEPLSGLTIRKEGFKKADDGYSTPQKVYRDVPIVPSDHFGLVVCFRSSPSSD